MARMPLVGEAPRFATEAIALRVPGPLRFGIPEGIALRTLRPEPFWLSLAGRGRLALRLPQGIPEGIR